MRYRAVDVVGEMVATSEVLKTVRPDYYANMQTAWHVDQYEALVENVHWVEVEDAFNDVVEFGLVNLGEHLETLERQGDVLQQLFRNVNKLIRHLDEAYATVSPYLYVNYLATLN